VPFLARGGAYGPARGNQAIDIQKPYLEAILHFMGIGEVHCILIEPTLQGGPRAAEAAPAEAQRQARDLTKTPQADPSRRPRPSAQSGAAPCDP